MSEAISETTGRPYGIQRVCRVWERARSSVYARRQRAAKRREGALPAPGAARSRRSQTRPSLRGSRPI